MLEEDPSVSIEELANCSRLSHGTVSRIHEDLQVRSVLAKWIPYKLSDVQKEVRVACAADMLSFYHQNRASFSRRLITIDEKWVYYRATGTKDSNRCWLGEDDPKPQVPRRIQHEKKSMIILAACFDGKFYLDVVPHGQNVDGDYYVEFLKKMRHSFHRRSTGNVDWHEMVIQHDNARPHTKASVSAFLDCCGVRLLPQSPYSPDYNLCDRWLFSRLENNRRFCNFVSEDHLKKYLTADFNAIGENEYCHQHDRLVADLKAVSERGGNYL
jgi:hypothetical protein